MKRPESTYLTPIGSSEAVAPAQTDSEILAELLVPITAERFFAFLEKVLFKTENYDRLPYLSYVKSYLQFNPEITALVKVQQTKRVNLITGCTTIFPDLKKAILTIVNELIMHDQVPYQNYAREIYQVCLTQIARYFQRFSVASNE